MKLFVPLRSRQEMDPQAVDGQMQGLDGRWFQQSPPPLRLTCIDFCQSGLQLFVHDVRVLERSVVFLQLSTEPLHGLQLLREACVVTEVTSSTTYRHSQ